jgi:hypothetical protein
MPKSGSTLAYIYTSSLLSYFFPSNAQQVFEQSVSEGKFKGGSAFLNWIDPSEFNLINSIRTEHPGPIHIKTHLSADQIMQSLQYSIGGGIATQEIKKHLDSLDIYIISTFRDPRDIILSAMDHRKRTILNSVPELAECDDIHSSIEFVKWACKIAISWKESDLALIVSYSDLVCKPEKVVQQISKHLKLEVNNEQISEVIERELTTRKKNSNQFNSGKNSRYKELMTDEQLQFCNRELSDYLQVLGYKA